MESLQRLALFAPLFGIGAVLFPSCLYLGLLLVPRTKQVEAPLDLFFTLRVVESLALCTHKRLLDGRAVLLSSIRNYRVGSRDLGGLGFLAGNGGLYINELAVCLVLVHEEPATKTAKLVVRGAIVAELLVQAIGVEGEGVKDLGLESCSRLVLVLGRQRDRVHKPIRVVLKVLGIRVQRHERCPHPRIVVRVIGTSASAGSG